MVLVFAVNCSDPPAEPPPEQPDPPEFCPDDDHLRGSVTAAEWAETTADIAEYVYGADIQSGSAEIRLVDASDDELGVAEFFQSFGDAEVPDGAIVATMQDDPTFRLVSWGEDVSHSGYTVQVRLEQLDGDVEFRIEARFEPVRCWYEQDDPVSPKCAPDLPLDNPAFTLPSCGVVVDELVRAHQPPELTRLTYSVSDDDAIGAPSVGGAFVEDGEQYHTIDVQTAGGVRELADIAEWLSDTGFDQVLGSREERLLTTAFLDRSWWREVDHHAAHCDVEKLPRPQTTSDSEDGDDNDVDTESMTLCPGDHSHYDWASEAAGILSDVWGDPHLTTLDGLGYDLQAAGEFILVEAHKGDPFTVQGRFEPLAESEIPGCGDLSWNTAAATEIGGHRVTATSHPDWEVRIDGQLVESPGDGPELDGDASIAITEGRVELLWPDGERIELIETPSSTVVGASSLTVKVELPPERRGQVRGLLGQFDGNPSTDLVLRDGTVIEPPATFEQLYEQLAPSWRIDADESLFDYAAGGDTHSFDIEGFPVSPTSVDQLPSDAVEDARETCLDEGVSDGHTLAACIVDVACFEDDDQAKAASNAKVPEFSQPPGRHDLAVERAIRHMSTPDEFAASDQDTSCRARAEPSIGLYDERLSTQLEDDVDIDLAEPGVYTEDSEFSPATLDAGTEVSSYHLIRDIPADPDGHYTGAVHFARPILGVIVDADRLTDTDGELGASSTSYQADGLGGLGSQHDVLKISDDRKSLDVVWSGEDAHRLRILVEARPSPND